VESLENVEQQPESQEEENESAIKLISVENGELVTESKEEEKKEEKKENKKTSLMLVN
jgi:hypothetical protein